MRKIALASLAAIAASLLIPMSAFAETPAGGTAGTTVSIISLSAAGKTIEVGTSLGKATTDQTKLADGALKANAMMNFGAAKVGDVLSTPVLSVATSGDKSSDTAADGTTIPLADASTVSGSLTLSGLKAQADQALPSASATLAQATGDLVLAGGLVSINGLKVGISTSSNSSETKALQGVQVARIYVVPLSEILDRATTLTADEVMTIAERFGGDATKDEIDTVNDSKQTLVSAVDTVSPGLLDTSVSIQAMLSCVSPMTAMICSLPPVADAMTALQGASDALEAAVGALPLVAINDITAGLSADASDTASAATAGIGWGSAQVLGISFPAAPDVQTTFAAVSAKVAEVQALLSTFTDLAGLTIKLDAPSAPTSHGESAGYRTASSAINAFGVHVNLAASEPLAVDMTMLKLASDAEHRPRIADPPGSPNRPLAKTGFNAMWIVAGLMLMTAAWRLRRWLGDAA